MNSKTAFLTSSNKEVVATYPQGGDEKQIFSKIPILKVEEACLSKHPLESCLLMISFLSTLYYVVCEWISQFQKEMRLVASH